MPPKSFLNKIIRLILLFIAFNIIGSIVTLLLLKMLFNIDGLAVLNIINNASTSSEGINALKFMQFIQVFFSFVIPAHLFARSESNNHVVDYLQMKKTNNINYLIAFLLVFSVAPLVSYLSEINEQVRLPNFMANVEYYFKNQQMQTEKFAQLFLQNNTGKDLIINIFIVGVLAAVSEELFFRGVLQKILIDRISNIHIAIFLCSILFSALHQEFYSLFPRVLLGMLLGYAYVYSQSIWVPIFIHFVNNTVAVVLDSLYKQGISSFNPNENEYFGIIGVIISLILSISLFWYWTKLSQKAIGINGERVG